MPNELNWSYPFKTVHGSSTECDVTINRTVSKSNEKGRLSFIFKNNSFRKVTKTDRVQLAVNGDRLYFRGAHAEMPGFKLSTGTNDTRRYLLIRCESIDVDPKQLEGSYKLQFDYQLKLPYIRIDKKL